MSLSRLEDDDIQMLLYSLNDYFSVYGSPEAAAACLRVADRYRWPIGRDKLDHLWAAAAGWPRMEKDRGA